MWSLSLRPAKFWSWSKLKHARHQLRQAGHSAGFFFCVDALRRAADLVHNRAPWHGARQKGRKMTDDDLMLVVVSLIAIGLMAVGII